MFFGHANVELFLEIGNTKKIFVGIRLR